MQYEGWSNPYGNNMADLIARSSDAQGHAAQATAAAQARAAEIRAQAYGQAAQNIGQIPNQIMASRDADVDRKLKEESLRQTIGQRAEAQRQRAVMQVGRIAGAAQSPEDFKAGIDDLASSGVLPAATAAHIKTQTDQAGAGGWAGLQGRFTTFAQQYVDPVKLGRDDTLAQPSLVPGQPARVVARGVPSTTVLRPGDVGYQGNPDNPTAPPAQVMSAPFAPGTGQHVVNGQVVEASGSPVGAAVPKQEGASEIALNNARVDQINKGIEKIDNEIAGTMGVSEKDRLELSLRRQQLSNELAHYKTIEQNSDVSSPRVQEKLEEQYRGILKTSQSSRSGGMGLEDKKVDQAKHLLTLLDQTRDPKTGSFNLTAQQQTELSVGLATLLSPTGVPGESTVKHLTQATAEGDLGKVTGYVLGKPIAGTPQAVAQQLYETIERQGIQAETNREAHFNSLRGFAPTDLSADRKAKVEQGLVNANRLSVEVNIPGKGMIRFPTQHAADAVLAALKAQR